MEMGGSKMFETKGRPIISTTDDDGNDGITLFIREQRDQYEYTVGVLASGSWLNIEVKKGKRADVDA
jgi:hypothetical protein